MELLSVRGLLADIGKRLEPGELDLLETAFNTLELEADGRKVAFPGKMILTSFHNEDALSDEARDFFQDKLVKLVRGALSRDPPVVYCCRYHREQLSRILPVIGPADQTWLITFLEILTAITGDVHFQMTSPIGRDETSHTLLSRFMPLHRFIEAYTTCDANADTERHFAEQLSPDFGLPTRKWSIDSGELGTWRGRIGTYPNPTVAVGLSVEQYQTYCEVVKPFGTLTKRVDEEFDRRGPPDQLLQKLGLTFGPARHWIELIYWSKDVTFMRKKDKTLHIGIPTRIESAGNWAFTPDRDTPPHTNFALNLAEGVRGLPEIVHERFDAACLRDAIVWIQPTQSNWSYPCSPFVLR